MTSRSFRRSRSRFPGSCSRTEILATTQQIAEDFKEEIAQLRVIARDAAITAELWLRSKHGTWRFFLVTPNSLVEIDRVGNRLMSGQTLV